MDHRWNVTNFFIRLEMDIGHQDLLYAQDDRRSRQDGGVPEYWVVKFNNEEEEYVNTISSEMTRELGYLMPIPLTEPTNEPEPEPTKGTTQKNNESVSKLQDIIDSVARGEKPELNEGEYLRLSQSLKGFFVSQ
jgi:hypothetical protein